MTSPHTTIPAPRPGRGAPLAPAAVGDTWVGDDAGLLQRCQRQIRAVLPHPPAGFEDLRSALSRHRRRPLTVAFTDPAGLTLPAALWLELHDHDLVWIDRRTSPMMRIVAACHEFGHIISGHQPARTDHIHPAAVRADAAEASRRRDVRTLARDRLGLPTDAIAAIMMRCGDPHQQASPLWHAEREAEMTGRLLAARILRHPRGLAQALTDP